MQEASFATSAPSAFGSAAAMTHPQHRTALEVVLAQWCSDRSYAVRPQNILGTGTEPSNNGSNYFGISKDGLTENAAFDDAAVDRLWDDSGIDWFFANNLGDLENRLDDIRDRTGSESKNEFDNWW